MVDEPVSAPKHNAAFGRYRFPVDMRNALAFGVAILSAFAIYGITVDHRPVWSHILIAPIMYLFLAVIVWIVPMTVVSEAGIHRWWSTQKSEIPWAKIIDVEARPVDRNTKYPVHARLANGDDIVLIGVPVSAVEALNHLSAGTSSESSPA